MRPSLALPKTLALAALAAAAAACGDVVTDPSALGESAEAEAVLRSAAALPALPSLLERAGDPPTDADRLALYRAQEVWAAGTAADDHRARARRRLAARYAAPVLARALSAEAWEEAERGLREWIATAESMLRVIAVPRVEARLGSARVQLDRAAAATDPESRAHALLLAGAELVETTPRFLARALAAEADVAVTRAISHAPDPEHEDLRRAARLRDWALRGVEEGDYLVAMQRAFYALQLVEAR